MSPRRTRTLAELARSVSKVVNDTSILAEKKKQIDAEREWTQLQDKELEAVRQQLEAVQLDKVSMEVEVHQLHQYIDIVKYCRDAAEGDCCQLRQRSARLAQENARLSLQVQGLSVQLMRSDASRIRARQLEHSITSAALQDQAALREQVHGLHASLSAAEQGQRAAEDTAQQEQAQKQAAVHELAGVRQQVRSLTASLHAAEQAQNTAEAAAQQECQRHTEATQVLASLQGAILSLGATFTSELGSLKQTLPAQAAEHRTINCAVFERFSAQITTLQARMEAQASEYDRFKSSIWSLMTELLCPLRAAVTQQSTQYAALQTSFHDQLTDLKTTHTVQHGDLVDVHAALHAVCAQIEAFKAMPAAVAKHVQGLRLQPGSVVTTVAPKVESSADTKEWSTAHKGVPRSLQHWDSALEESGYSPRISSRVTPPAATHDPPAKGRTDSSMTPPLSSVAAASDAHMLGEMPSKSPTSGCQVSEMLFIPGFAAKVGPNPSGIPPSDGLASDAHTSGQKVTVLTPIPEAEEEGQAAEPVGSVHLSGGGAVPNLPPEVTCGDPDHVTHVPKLAAAASGDAAMPEVQSVEPAAQHPADSASNLNPGSQRAADSASGISAAATHPAGLSAPGHSSSSLAELVSETAKVEVPDVPLLPCCPTLDGSPFMAVSSTMDPPSSATLTPSMTPVESGTMPLDGAAACTASDIPDSQIDKDSSLTGDLVSAAGDSAESDSANADSEAAAGVSNMQSAAAEGSAENIGAGPAAGSPTLAAVLEESPSRAARASETAPAEGTPINGAAGSHPAQGIPNADAASSPSAQGILVPEASGAVPAEGIHSRIAASDEVVYPIFGVAREQNGRPYMEDRADVLELQLPCGEQAHMLAVYDGHNGDRAAHRTMLNMECHLMHALHKGNSVLAGLATAFDDAERDLLMHHQRVVAKPEWFALEGGTTALVAVLHHNQLYLANVGDCRAVLGRRMPGVEMEAVVVTQDHKPNLEQQRGAARLAQEQLYWEEGVAYLTTHPQPDDGQEVQRLALSRSLGDFDLTGLKTTQEVASGQHVCGGPLISAPQIHQHPLQSGDELLILASDGLWDKVDSKAAVSEARRHLALEGTTAASCAQVLVQLAIVAGSTDNITVVIAKLRDVSKAHMSQDARPQRLQFYNSKSQGARH